MDHIFFFYFAAVIATTSVLVVALRNPVYSALALLIMFFHVAGLYVTLHAEFLAAVQIVVYAGAILVIFVFVIVLFQDAHEQLAKFAAKSKPFLLYLAAGLFLLTLLFLAGRLMNLELIKADLPPHYGSVQALGEALYLDFFFPFEAVILLFLTAGLGALYIAKREK